MVELAEKNIGHITQVIGSTLDVEFAEDNLPKIYNALEVVNQATGQKLVCEVQKHLGRNQVRAVAMDTTDGLVRGAEVTDTGQPSRLPSVMTELLKNPEALNRFVQRVIVISLAHQDPRQIL